MVQAGRSKVFHDHLCSIEMIIMTEFALQQIGIGVGGLDRHGG